MAGIVVAYVISIRGETIPAFIGMVVGQIITALTLVARWVLSYHARETRLDLEDQDNVIE